MTYHDVLDSFVIGESFCFHPSETTPTYEAAVEREKWSEADVEDLTAER